MVLDGIARVADVHSLGLQSIKLRCPSKVAGESITVAMAIQTVGRDSSSLVVADRVAECISKADADR